MLISDGHNISAGGVVHAQGYLKKGGLNTMLRCGGRVAASQIRDVGNEMVTCFWCITEIEETSLRWFTWGDGS